MIFRRHKPHTHKWDAPYLGMFGRLWHQCTTCDAVAPYNPMASDV